MLMAETMVLLSVWSTMAIKLLRGGQVAGQHAKEVLELVATTFAPALGGSPRALDDEKLLPSLGSSKESHYAEVLLFEDRAMVVAMQRAIQDGLLSALGGPLVQESSEELNAQEDRLLDVAAAIIEDRELVPSDEGFASEFHRVFGSKSGSRRSEIRRIAELFGAVSRAKRSYLLEDLWDLVPAAAARVSMKIPMMKVSLQALIDDRAFQERLALREAQFAALP